MKWDNATVSTLLTLVFQQNPNLKIDVDDIIKRWPDADKPSARQVSDRIRVIRKQPITPAAKLATVPVTPVNRAKTEPVPPAVKSKTQTRKDITQRGVVKAKTDTKKEVTGGKSSALTKKLIQAGKEGASKKPANTNDDTDAELIENEESSAASSDDSEDDLVVLSSPTKRTLPRRGKTPALESEDEMPVVAAGGKQQASEKTGKVSRLCKKRKLN